MSARTLENMLCRGSNIRVEVIGGTRTTLSGAKYTISKYFRGAIRGMLKRDEYILRGEIKVRDEEKIIRDIFY